MKMFTDLRMMTGLAVVSMGLLLGACEHRVVETTHTTEGPNGSTVEKRVVTQNNDGTVTEQKETRTVNDH